MIPEFTNKYNLKIIKTVPSHIYMAENFIKQFWVSFGSLEIKLCDLIMQTPPLKKLTKRINCAHSDIVIVQHYPVF